MNKHLKPVFEVLLPGLEEAQIDYRVFGGVSMASYSKDNSRNETQPETP